MAHGGEETRPAPLASSPSRRRLEFHRAAMVRATVLLGSHHGSMPRQSRFACPQGRSLTALRWRKAIPPPRLRFWRGVVHHHFPAHQLRLGRPSAVHARPERLRYHDPSHSRCAREKVGQDRAPGPDRARQRGHGIHCPEPGDGSREITAKTGLSRGFAQDRAQPGGQQISGLVGRANGVRRYGARPSGPPIERCAQRASKSFGLRRPGCRRRPFEERGQFAASLRPPLNGRSDRDRSRFLPATRARSARCGRSRCTASRNADRDSFP